MADVSAFLSPPKKLKFDNVKSVAANLFDSTSQIASDINNERTSSVVSNEYSKASPVKKKKKRKVHQSEEGHGKIDDKEPFERSPEKKIKMQKKLKMTIAEMMAIDIANRLA